MIEGKYFSNHELMCKCGCGKNLMKRETVSRLDALRARYGPIRLNSAFRCEEYNLKMGYTMTHASGQAADISCAYGDAYEILKHALFVGFTGIGISQKGDSGSRFIHVDDLPRSSVVLRPTIWSY